MKLRNVVKIRTSPHSNKIRLPSQKAVEALLAEAVHRVFLAPSFTML